VALEQAPGSRVVLEITRFLAQSLLLVVAAAVMRQVLAQ